MALEFVGNIVEVAFDDDDPAGDKIVVDIGLALEEIPLEYFVVAFGCKASFDFDDGVDFEKDGLAVDRIEIYFDRAELAEDWGFVGQNMVGNDYFGYFFEELHVHIVDFDFGFELVDYLLDLCYHLLFHQEQRIFGNLHIGVIHYFQ